MNDTTENIELNFSEPAVYKIMVQGELSQYHASNLGNMELSAIKKPECKPISVLVGEVRDQAALSGILNSLYDLHLTVLSVKVYGKSNI